MREIVLGFLLAVVVSVPGGLAVAFSRGVERVMMPVLVFTQLIPKIALAPLADREVVRRQLAVDLALL